MIYTVSLNPAIDKTVTIHNFRIGEVNRISSLRIDAGGKGINVSKVINSLGGESCAFGVLGYNGDSIIRKALDQANIGYVFIPMNGDVRINLKIIDEENKTNTDINESGFPVPDEILSRVLNQLANRIVQKDIVVLSGSLPPETKQSIYKDWTEILQAKGARIFLDADREPFRSGIEAAPFLIKPNRAELEQLYRRALDTIDDLVIAGKKLIDKGIEIVVISLGGDGSLLRSVEQILYAEGLRVPVRSTVGAGDAMIGSLALSVEQELPFVQAARMAAAVSSAKVMCPGSNPPDLEQINLLLDQIVIRSL